MIKYIIAPYLNWLRSSPANLLARGLRHGISYTELEFYYVSRISNEFDEDELRLLDELEKGLKQILKSRWPGAVHISYDFYKTWDNLENGFPHTHGTSIFIPEHMLKNKSITLKTMVHEFVHVYQRTNPVKTHNLLSHWGYTPVCHVAQFRKNNYLLRANPDLNDLIYMDKEGNIEFMKFTSCTPSSILDVTNVKIGGEHSTVRDSIHEHPFEYMAYTLSEILMGDTDDSDDYIRTWLTSKN
jgi:hypothetical protein